MISQERIGRSEEVQSAILEKIEENDGSVNLARIYDELGGLYRRDEIRCCISNLQQAGRICFTLGDQFGLPD